MPRHSDGSFNTFEYVAMSVASNQVLISLEVAPPNDKTALDHVMDGIRTDAAKRKEQERKAMVKN